MFSVAFIVNVVLIVKLFASNYIFPGFDFTKELVAHKPKGTCNMLLDTIELFDTQVQN